jgi:hypothetical protein
MKTCCRCKVEQETTEFYKHSGKKDGLSLECRTCIKERANKYYKENTEKAKNKVKQYKKENNHKVNALCYKRKTKKLQRTPEWLSTDHFKQIELEYELATWCSKVMGVKYHVDHIVPLLGINVSGLHVPWNLRVIPASVNLSKSNKYE